MQDEAMTQMTGSDHEQIIFIHMMQEAAIDRSRTKQTEWYLSRMIRLDSVIFTMAKEQQHESLKMATETQTLCWRGG